MRLWLFLLLILSTSIQPVMAQGDDPTGELYKPMEFTMAVDEDSYLNPFNTNDIELIGLFQSPSDQQFVIPGFWMQPYENACVDPCEGYELQPAGEPVWMVRFTPQEVGEWRYTLQVRDNASVSAVEDGRFTVEDSDAQGFIRLGENERYFEYANGDPYFPIGHNLKWSFDGIGGLETYDRWLRELSESGGNYARLFIDVPWFISLEWAGPAGDYRSAQEAAAMLDIILERAAEYGVHLQLVLLWHQALRTYTGPPVIVPDDVPRPDVGADWDDNPYNVLNGGVLSGASVFFFDDEAQQLFRRRLRYIVARWGYSPQVFAWEIIDRVDQTANFDPDVSDPWLRGAVNYLRQIDPHDHLITASSRDFTTGIADNALLDFAGAQFYQRRPIESTGDQVTGVVDRINQYLILNNNPVMLVDYSLNPWFEPIAEDPEGVHFQNTLWAAVMAGASGGAVSDWWDTYVIPQELSRYYAPLAAFTAGVAWSELNLEPAQAGLLATNDENINYEPVRIENFQRQLSSRSQTVTTHVITADGVFPDVSGVPSYLYGQVYNNQFSQAQRYRVAPPVDTFLEIGIASVSAQADAQLIVEIDGQRVVQVGLRAGNRDITVRVPLSAGEHSIVLDNMGEDWLELAYIEVGDLVAPARVFTLRDTETGVALSWLQHRDYTWEKVAEGIERDPLSFEYRLDGMPAGRYVAEIWDPLVGAVLGEEILRVGDDGVLAFDLLPVDRQLALRAMRQPEPTPAPTLESTETPAASATPTASTTATATSSPTQTPAARSTLTPSTAQATSLPTLMPFVASTNTPRPSLTPRPSATDMD